VNSRTCPSGMVGLSSAVAVPPSWPIRPAVSRIAPQ